MEQSRLLTAPPWSPAGGRRVQSSVCGRRAQGLAGRTRRPGVAVAEGSGSSERRRRRVVAAVAARATCMHARERLPPSCSVRKHGFGGRSWFTDVLPPAEGLPGRRVDRRTRSLRRRTKIPRYARILIIFFSCGGMSCSCQWYRVCDAGALRAEPLATLMSCAVKITTGPSERGIGTAATPQAAWRGAVERPSGGPSAPGRRCWRLGRKRPSPFSNSGPTPLRSDPNLEGHEI